MLELEATAISSSFANNAESTKVLKAFTHLANDTANDRQSIAKLTELNATLVTKNKNLQEKLVAALEKLSTNVPLNNRQQGRKRGGKEKYSWSCGSNSSHLSKDCCKEKNGYQDDATEDNKIGGNTFRWWSNNNS